MAKEKRLYWRKKGKSIVLEGRLPSNKPILIWTLPDANSFWEEILSKASFLTQEKVGIINEKVMRLAHRDTKPRKTRQEVPTININGTPDLDAKVKEDLIRKAWELSK